MRRLSTTLTVATVCAGLALAGCGSSSSSTVRPSAYVHSFCGAVGPFAQDLVTRTGALNLTSLKSPAQGKAAIHGYLAAIESDAATALTKLRKAGAPDVKDGQRIASQVITAFSSLDGAMKKAVGQAANLPTTSAAALKAGTLRLDGTLRDSMNGISKSMAGSTLKNPQLQKALTSDPACKALTGA